MGVKNLWGVLSSTGQLVAVGSPGDPVKGSILAIKKIPPSSLPNSKTKINLPSSDGDLQLSLSALCLSDDAKAVFNINAQELSSFDIGQAFSGQAVAIDLSCWVCDSQANSNMHSVTRPHLRNLVFRTWSLLSVGVLPVFVVEGKAPELKQTTMQARNAQRGGSASQSRGTNRATRSRFNSVLKECCELFELLGVPWVQAEGEAEATCAALFSIKTVCGVISEDSDVLLYGGDNVLRNFSVQANRPTAEIFTLSNIETKLHLPRDCLVVLSLLLGCDYLPAGVAGVGVSSAVKLLSHWGQTGIHAIEKFKSWAAISGDLTAPVAKFKKNGDIDALEAAIRDRAVRTEGFPFDDVVQEFTARIKLPPGGALSGLCWKQPDYTGLLSWCERKLGWEPGYSTEKASLFCARWLTCHAPAPGSLNRCALQASRIVKTCTRGGVASYEVEWRISRHSDREVGGGAGEDGVLVTTVEPQQMIQFAFSRLVEHFEEEKAAKKKGKGKKKKVADDETVKRQPRKNANKKCQDSCKQLKLIVCSTSSGPSLTLAKVGKSDLSKNAVNGLGFVDNNLKSLDDTEKKQQLPDSSNSLQTLTLKDIDRREGGCINQSDSIHQSRTNKTRKRNSASTNKERCASKTRGDSSRFNPNTKSSRLRVEVVDLDTSDDTSSPTRSPPLMEDSLLNFDSFEDVKCDSPLASDDDSENDVSFIVDRFINLNVDQRKALRDHQPVSSGSSKERSKSVESIKHNNLVKLKGSRECEDFDNDKENSPLLSLMERAKLHANKKQDELLSTILSESKEFNSNDAPLAYRSNDQCSGNLKIPSSAAISLEKPSEKLIEYYRYETLHKKELTTIVQTANAHCEDYQNDSFGERFGSLSPSKSNPIPYGSSLDGTTTTLFRDPLQVETSTEERLSCLASKTNSHSGRADYEKSSRVGSADYSYYNDSLASSVTDFPLEAESISLSHDSQSLISISGSVEGKACDGSFDLFDDSLASESSHCSTTVDDPQQGPHLSQKLEITSRNQGSGRPCFKLLDSFWMDSKSFLCTPSPSKRTCAVPSQMSEDKFDNSGYSSAPRHTTVMTPGRNVSDKSHSNIQINRIGLSSQLCDEHLIAPSNSPDVDKSFDVRSNFSEKSRFTGTVNQKSNFIITPGSVNEADSPCNANLMTCKNYRSAGHRPSESHPDKGTAFASEKGIRSATVKSKVDAVALPFEIETDSLPSTLLNEFSSCSLPLLSSLPSSVVISSKPSASLSSSSFCHSPSLQTLSLADRMKVKYGKKTVSTLLPHTKF